MRNKQAYKTQAYKQYKSAEKGWQTHAQKILLKFTRQGKFYNI